MILPRVKCSEAFHDGCWFFKFILIAGVYIAVFFIPNGFYTVWAYIARVASGLFLIMQVVLIIIAAYNINDALVGSFNNSKGVASSTCNAIILIGLTFIFSAGSIVIYVFEFIWFHGCGGTIAIIVVTIVFAILFFVFVLLRFRDDASILTSSIVAIYSAYLGWSAMASIPNTSCNPFTVSNANTICQIFIGMVITFFALISISVMSRSS
jgi:hypothetical protein